MSILFPYLYPVACSGAINNIVPMISLILSCPWNTFEWTSADKPKSAILAEYLSYGLSGCVPSSLYFSSMRIFSGFMSLWIKFLMWICDRPLHMSLVMDAATYSGITLSLYLMVGLLSAELAKSARLLLLGWTNVLCVPFFLFLMNDSSVPPLIFSISINTWCMEYSILLKIIIFRC